MNADARSDMALSTLRGQILRTFELFGHSYPAWRTELVEEIDSTSTEARRRAGGGGPDEPFILVALSQSNGRGQQHRRWSAPPGTSLLFTAAIPLERLGRCSSGLGRPTAEYPVTLWPLQVAVALALRLRLFGWEAEVKWPNDILIAGGKVCGILCESVGGWFLCGVGLNVLQRAEDFHGVERGKVPPTSLLLAPRAGGLDLDPVQVTPSLLQSVMTVLESPWPKGRMLGYYREWCMTLGSSVAYHAAGGKLVHGIATEVLDDGRLLVETPESGDVAVSSGFEEITNE